LGFRAAGRLDRSGANSGAAARRMVCPDRSGSGIRSLWGSACDDVGATLAERENLLQLLFGDGDSLQLGVVAVLGLEVDVLLVAVHGAIGIDDRHVGSAAVETAAPRPGRLP